MLGQVLVPTVVLGVESRRLVKGPKGYEDAPVTDPSMPSVLFAKAMKAEMPKLTRLFPVFAELIEVAKAVRRVFYSAGF